MNEAGGTPVDDESIDAYWFACTRVLGRRPIDRFEAAVTLEAHDGLAAGHALAVGRRFAEQGRFAAVGGVLATLEIDGSSTGTGLIEVVTVEESKPDNVKRLFGEVVFMVSVLMVGFWVSSMADELGLAAVDHAWRIALPASLGSQWFLRRRYLSGEQGLGRLRRELPVAGVILAVVGVAGFLGEGWLGAVLGLLWSAGFLIARRGWWLQQSVILVAMIVAHPLGVPSAWLLVVSAIIAVGAALIGVATSTVTLRKASPWHAGLLAGAVGSGLGALLVVEPEFVWSVTVPLPILTVLPSLLGSLWGAANMSSLWAILPGHLRSTPLSTSSASAAGKAVRRLVLSSVSRIVLLTFAGSAAVLWWAHRAEHPSSTTQRLLIAHALLAVAGLCVSLLEGYGRSGQALFCVMLGVSFALIGPRWNLGSFPPASRILLAATVTMVSSLSLVLLQLRDPARSIAAGI